MAGLTPEQVAEISRKYRSASGRMTEERAVKEFGYRWMSFVSIPVKGTPGYPQETRVRQLFSPGQLESQSWKKFFLECDAKPATGDEPLAYTYCSSFCTVAALPSLDGLRSEVMQAVPALIETIEGLRAEVRRLQQQEAKEQ